MIYNITGLNSARNFLLHTTEKNIILSNPIGSTHYYGMRVIHFIFNTLQQEFPAKISGCIVNTSNDYSALITARKLGYSKIIYTLPHQKHIHYLK